MPQSTELCKIITLVNKKLQFHNMICMSIVYQNTGINQYMVCDTPRTGMHIAVSATTYKDLLDLFASTGYKRLDDSLVDSSGTLIADLVSFSKFR